MGSAGRRTHAPRTATGCSLLTGRASGEIDRPAGDVDGVVAKTLVVCDQRHLSLLYEGHGLSVPVSIHLPSTAQAGLYGAKWSSGARKLPIGCLPDATQFAGGADGQPRCN